MKKALLLSVNEDVEQIRSLLDTLNIEVLKQVIQRRGRPHAVTYLGSGKLDEVSNEISSEEFDVIVVNGVLRPSQHHTLEMKFGVECVDRIGVILRIFAERAHTEEAKRQVTLARMRYELPFLREWIHKSKAGERPGFLSGGAYATEVYYEHARSHVKKIEEELRKGLTHRERMRNRRRQSGYVLVSIAGYTNAGKTSLMNALCDSSAEVDDKLFATLTTTTRKIALSKKKILITDTVGFISNLPAGLVHAFRSTFEEVFLADIILLVVDISEANELAEMKANVCLNEISAEHEQRPIIVVGTKADLLDSCALCTTEKMMSSLARENDWLLVSSTNGTGLDELVNLIESRKVRDRVIAALLPLRKGTHAFISELHGFADVSEVSHTESRIEISLVCNADDFDKAVGRIEAAGGTVLSTRVSTQEENGVLVDRSPREMEGGP
ncbi:MAG: GTPase HflX [Methanobacteriota archaeon]|nr:MAG: GTPase HflX [Euryarchaeota archaeon]